MHRHKKDDDATQNLRPKDKTQTTPKETKKLGHHGRSEVLSDFARIVHDKKG
jgi:hypothetical protein